MCSQEGFMEEVTYEMNLKNRIGVYHVRKESKGKQGAVDCMSSLEEG